MTEPFRINDRRGSRSRLVLDTSVERAKEAADRGVMSREGVVMRTEGDTNPFSRMYQRHTDDVVAEMRMNRRANGSTRRTGRRVTATAPSAYTPGSGGGYGFGGDGAMFATARPRDPMFYWKQNNLPYDTTEIDELVKIRAFCRLLYQTHPLVAACTDIFTKFPLQGMDFVCKDSKLEEFYSQLFFDQLDYKSYLKDVGREYWLTGEAWPLASFNEKLGVWEDEELLNPDTVRVEKSPFLKEPRYLIELPQTLKDVLQKRSPRWEYEILMQSYPELAAYTSDNALMPVSNMLLRQLKFTGDTFNPRGIPILMRGFRAIIQEEMLNSAMDAIADRLYTPLLLVKLGASAQDLGTSVPWIPTRDDLDDFNESLDLALAGDFRVLTHHFATEMEPVFGRENMPDMSNDFDRIEDRILMVYGLSRTMLQGADSGETYAADALNRDVVTQLLTDFQSMLKDFVRQRMLIVAEAQEHFDYEERNGKRYVKMEEILEYDEETGEERIVEQPALLVPDLEFDTMNLQDKNMERQFTEALNAAGVPVPYKQRLLSTGMSFEAIVEQRQDEQVALAIAEQETRKRIFLELRAAGLPIAQDLIDDFQPKATKEGEGSMPAGQDAALPSLGAIPPDLPVLAPGPQDLEDTDEENAEAPAQPGSGGLVLMPGGAGMEPDEEGDQRPSESDEQRARMPKPASRHEAFQKEAVYHAGSIRSVTDEHYTAPQDYAERIEIHGELVDNTYFEADPSKRRPTGNFGAPRHVGMRRYLHREGLVSGEMLRDDPDEEASA